MEVVRVEINEVGWAPRVPKSLRSNCRLLSRKNDMTEVVFKEGFRRQAEFHMTLQTQQDWRAELSSVHVGRSHLGLDQRWL